MTLLGDYIEKESGGRIKQAKIPMVAKIVKKLRSSIAIREKRNTKLSIINFQRKELGSKTKTCDIIKIKVLNKYLALITYGLRSPEIAGNPFELAKQAVMYQCKATNKHMPCFGLDIYMFQNSYPDLISWYETAGCLPYEVLESIDFSKPYDDTLFAKYRKQKVAKKTEINADDLINAELEG